MDCIWLLSWILLSLPVHAIDLNLDSTDNIRQISSELAWDLVSFYTGNNTGDVPGNLPDPYYWWEAGAFFGALINYWVYTGDATYNAITKQALLHQAGDNADFMPKNQTYTEGNDDQSFWAFTAMMAAESNFTNPDEDQPSWLSMVQAVFNEQAARWNTEACGGGLKWQIYTFNSGYNYRNSISNGCFFNIAARLARYTGNETYAEWADKMWDWIEGIGLIGPEYQVYDGTTDTNNCTDMNHIQWTYNNGVLLHGAANMWNYVRGLDQWTWVSLTDHQTNGNGNGTKWQTRINNLLDGQGVFFSTNESSSNVMYEHACEQGGTCTTDQLSFKAYLARWMGATAKLAPFTYDIIMTRLRATAQAATAQCIGGDTGTYCGMKWTTGEYDGTTGVGQQMAVLEVVQANLVNLATGPLTNDTGGSSQGNSAAGTDSEEDPEALSAITTADQVGAGIVTALVVCSIFGGVYLMVS